MDKQNMFGAIQADDWQQSAEKELFSNLQKGLITSEQYYTDNARLTGEKLNQYPVYYYSSFLPAFLDYCQGRIDGRRNYDQSTARLIAQWSMDCFRMFEENNHSQKHLQWAKEKCEASGLTSHVDRLCKKINEFTKNKLPLREFELAMKVLKIDSYARARD